MTRRPAQIALFAAILAACGGDDDPQCRVGADCASGICFADGTCAPVADGGLPGGSDGAAAADAPPAADADPSAPDGAPAPDGGPALCSPDGDDVVTRDEMPLAAGLHATFRVAQDATVSTAGTPLPGGRRRWDLSAALPGDANALVETLPLAGTWYAATFPGATYAARLSASSDLLGVFEVTAGALLLRGVVSPEDGLTRTELTYDPAVVVIELPLASGGTWTTDATVSGVALGVFGVYSESYESQVDAVGEMVTPYGTFPVLRVRVVLTRTVGFAVTTVRSFLFVAECFGTVATVVAQDNESEVEFTDAAEVRRLAP